MVYFGFREGLQPNSRVNALILDAIDFSQLSWEIAFISTQFRFKIQFVILGIIVLSLCPFTGPICQTN